MIEIKKKLGSRIKELRVNHKWTQEMLAEKINIETASLSNIENGKNYPSAETLEKLINAFRIQPQEIFTFEHLEKPPAEELLNEMIAVLKNNTEMVYKMYDVFKIIHSKK